MDIDLVDSIVEAFGEERNILGDEIFLLRVIEHGVDAEPLDLLESFYSTTDYSEYIGKLPGVLLSTRSTESNFSFIAPSNVKRVDFTISCRTPGREESGKSILIFANDGKNALTQIPMSRDWVSWSFSLSGERLKAGTNRLSIHWPYSFQPLPAAKAGGPYALTKLMYPILGEISSFQAVVRNDLRDLPAIADLAVRRQ
jgi:hypothetical protein